MHIQRSVKLQTLLPENVLYSALNERHCEDIEFANHLALPCYVMLRAVGNF